MKYIMSDPMIVTGARIDLKDCTVKFKDGTATPVELEIKVGEGNITWSEKVNRDYMLDRGTLDTVRNGDEVPVDVSIDLVWEFLTGTGATGAVGTPRDFLKKIGAYAANVSSDTTDACAPYAIDIEIVDDVNCGTLPVETITLADFRYEELGPDMKASSIACTGKCNITEATAVRSAS